MSDVDEDKTRYIAVINHEEQYSIWPDYKEIPRGWRDAGVRGSKKECLDWIESVWTDMRPLSLRVRMAEWEEKVARGEVQSEPAVEVDQTPPLVERLCANEQPLIASRSRTAAELKRQIDRGYVLLKFTETRGGTELGMNVIADRCIAAGGDFEQGTGAVHLVGTLVLDGTPVELIANLDLATLRGTGKLQART